MVSIKASYLYTHSLLRGVTFEVLTFSSFALSPSVGKSFGTPVVEQLSVPSSHFLEAFNILIHSPPLQQTYISGNSHKPFGAKAG